jgi:putative mRNA 3-end processing factor
VLYQITSDVKHQIILTSKEKEIYLDPTQILAENYVFISHAHIDHMLNKTAIRKFNLRNKIMCSPETVAIANLRGYFFEKEICFQDDCTLVDTGHILGSKGLLIGNEIFYTGDLSMRDRAFLRKPSIPKAETLIIETTFGKPEYIFPPIEQITHSVNSLVSEMYSRGVPVILMGYSLGKAQVLTSLFGAWKPLIVHDEIFKFNQMYEQFGVSLENSTSLSDAIELGLLDKGPWIMIHPLTNGKHPKISHYRQKYGAITIGFSGWALNRNYRNMMNLDYVIPFSDHCDHSELLEVVKKCNPRKIYTFHGFQEEFANYLVKLGYDAVPIKRGSSKVRKESKRLLKTKSLDNYF